MEKAMLDEAWTSALDDWQQDTAGHRELTFEAFRDSVLEITSLYSDECTERAFLRFTKALVDGITMKPKGEKVRQWRHKWPQGGNFDEAWSALEHLRAALVGRRYALEVGAKADPVAKRTLQRKASSALLEWLTSVGTSPANDVCIATPADLMVALMSSFEAACKDCKEANQGSKDSKAAATALQTVLAWIIEGQELPAGNAASPGGAKLRPELGTMENPVRDHAGRSRLITLYRILDANSDGTIGESDLQDSLLIDGNAAQLSPADRRRIRSCKGAFSAALAVSAMSAATKPTSALGGAVSAATRRTSAVGGAVPAAAKGASVGGSGSASAGDSGSTA